jgi:hypothetical protein
MAKRFLFNPQCPDWFWGPSSLLSNGYMWPLFPRSLQIVKLCLHYLIHPLTSCFIKQPHLGNSFNHFNETLHIKRNITPYTKHFFLSCNVSIITNGTNFLPLRPFASELHFYDYGNKFLFNNTTVCMLLIFQMLCMRSMNLLLLDR